MNSSKARTGLKKNLILNNVSGLYYKGTEEDKENVQVTMIDKLEGNLNNMNILHNLSKGKQSEKLSANVEKEREFGRDITGYINNCSEYLSNFSSYQKNKVILTETNVGNKAGRKNSGAVTTTNSNANQIKNYFKKETQTLRPSNVQPIKFIPNFPNTMKNKDVVNMNINVQGAINNINNNNVNNNIFTTFNNNERNLKINQYCRQKKNTSLQLEYPNYNQIQSQRNPFVAQKIITVDRKASTTRQASLGKIKEKSAGRPKCTSFAQIANKENVDMNCNTLGNENYYSETSGKGSCCGTYSTTQTVADTTGGTSSKQSHLSFNQNPTPTTNLINIPVSIPVNVNIPVQVPINVNLQVHIKPDDYLQLMSDEVCFPKEELAQPLQFHPEPAPHSDSQLKLEQFLQPENKLIIPEHLKEYLEDIYRELKIEESESKGAINPDYFLFQCDINEQMRAILIDWLIEVQLKFKLRDETLFLTVILIDKYLSKKLILRSKLQLLGVSAMMIACKQEEILVPHVRDFVYITDKAYQNEEVLAMEAEVLNVLDFKVLSPSSLRFYELIAQFFKFDMKEFMFGRYMMEIFLLDPRINKYSPSIIACTSAYIVMKYFNFKNYQLIYSPFFLSNGNAALMKDCAREMINLLENNENSSLGAVRRKFAKKEFCQVSLIKY